eukprot:Blabericola_migrator_1__2199@NODE_1607_length_4178_cov_706_440525_g922_i1_p2_GENE_NODE_1607_length_4178_cov_706_440525_g922_i1NODE_1607_length_4178_cov_706_440525_g922_i1_p2_ORF_typecomplete_len204_score46_15_NODE_1607_length_4178_cov_706_440525_g922_i14131024
MGGFLAGVSCCIAHLTPHPHQTPPPHTLHSHSRSLCRTPGAFEVDPYICLPGDWSGKFGPLQLTQPRGVKPALFSGSRDSDGLDVQPAEVIRVFADPLPIPSCVLADKALSFTCTDGRIAGCSYFKMLGQRGASKTQSMETALQFFLTVSQNAKVPQYTGDMGWQDKFISSDYWGHLWEDVKRKSKDFWEYTQANDFQWPKKM